MNTYTGSGRGDFRTLYQGKSVDDLIIEYMEINELPGMSLAIVQAPYITRVLGYGIADTETKRLVSTRTLFNVGQLTNAFTAVAIMQLKEEGKLKLDELITTYLPPSPKSWNKISIRHLLTHSSGLADYTEQEGFAYSKNYQPAEIVRLISERPLLFSAGTEMQTSATNFYLLGLIVEAASDMSYVDYVTKNQIERVGLQRTFFIKNAAAIENEVHNGSKPFKHRAFLQNPSFIDPAELAVGYNAEQQSVANATWSATFANSGVVATAEDISIWDISLAGSILVKDAADRAFLYNSPSLDHQKIIPANAGWLFPGHQGLMEIKGAIPGFSSFLSRFTAANELLCVTLLANKENVPDLDILARKIAAAFDANLGAPTGRLGSETLQSPYSVTETIRRLSALINHQGGKIFAHIDHRDEAKKVNQTLLPTEVLIIGNPAKGTALMQENAASALDLPLRIMVTEDKSGQVWLSFTDPLHFAAEYHLPNKDLKQMATALYKLCAQAVSAQSTI